MAGGFSTFSVDVSYEVKSFSYGFARFFSFFLSFFFFFFFKELIISSFLSVASVCRTTSSLGLPQATQLSYFYGPQASRLRQGAISVPSQTRLN